MVNNQTLNVLFFQMDSLFTVIFLSIFKEDLILLLLGGGTCGNA